MAAGTPANMQGDLFSRGFPKFNESYYFFSIVTGQASAFTENLAKLMQEEEIPTLRKVLDDWDRVDAHKPAILPISHALIAFSMTGLERIQVGLPKDKLKLDMIRASDPVFARGMAQDGTDLNDPDRKDWDLLFRSQPIHGVLKVAGSSANEVKTKLDRVKGTLGYPTVITDVVVQSSSTNVDSQVDGEVRSGENKGKEHFGFEDGVSQPLLNGINKPDVIKDNTSMLTLQSVITVTAERHRIGLSGAKSPCPDWMYDGSFLVFRKLEQDVGKFQEYTRSKYEAADCTSAEQFGARLMGRWQSGKAYVDSPNGDPKDGHGRNEFTFANPQGCALAAHIRKVRLRGVTEVSPFVRIIRNGIPYGTDYVPGDTSSKRGLLFACYQSSIENGFRHIQRTWVNFAHFPIKGAGYDPFIGQPPKNEKLQTAVFNSKNELINPGLWDVPKFVTMRGGEYFFAPSISALTSVLGSP